MRHRPPAAQSRSRSFRILRVHARYEARLNALHRAAPYESIRNRRPRAFLRAFAPLRELCDSEFSESHAKAQRREASSERIAPFWWSRIKPKRLLCAFAPLRELCDSESQNL